MSFNIHEEITTKLHYKDVASIAVAMGIYQEQFKYTADPEILLRMERLVNRLGNEIANCKQDDDTNH